MSASMNASWMFASTIVALLFVLAATVLEQVASLRRGVPLRWIWVTAMALLVGLSASWLPSGALRSAAPASTIAAAPASAQTVGAAAASSRTNRANGAVATLAATAAAFVRLRADVALPRLPNQLEFAIRRTWYAGSAAFLLLLFWSGVRLWRDRRRWTWATVLDAEVLVSDGFGPAIVGIVRPAIVVPAWVLALDAAAQRTILVHEEEHRRAGDARLLLAALALLVLMPWNVGLWWLWRRLNRAVELDCDERVLGRGVRCGDYANVLLSAWQRSRGAVWIPSPAFAERASGLGKRVEHLMRPESRRRAMKTVTGSFGAAVLIAAAMVVPTPQRAQGVAVHQAGLMPLILVDGEKRKDIVDAKTGQAVINELMAVRYDTVSVGQDVDSADAVRLYGADGVHGARALWTKRYLANGGAMLPSNVVRSIILDYQVKQRALSGQYLAVWPKRLALDSVRALLDTDAKSEAFDKRQELLVKMRAQSSATSRAPGSATSGAPARAAEGPANTAALRGLTEVFSGGVAVSTADAAVGQNPPLFLIDGVKQPRGRATVIQDAGVLIGREATISKNTDGTVAHLKMTGLSSALRSACDVCNALRPGEIASVEVVKGQAARTKYGDEAGNGVVLIVTKRGHP